MRHGFSIFLAGERAATEANRTKLWFDDCGYGTFTIPVAKRISGMLTTFDIDPAVRDVFAEGFGGEAESEDACLLFNILHCEEPVKLLAEGARVVRPGGAVLVIHWRFDPATPRGPSMEIRPRPEQIAQWAAQTGLLEPEGRMIDLPPWHYGVRLRRLGGRRGNWLRVERTGARSAL